MRRNLKDFNKSKDELDERAPYNYEEYCKKFKMSKKNNNKGVKIISIVGLSVLAIILIYFISTFTNGSKAIEETTIVKKSEDRKIILAETWDKGIGLQLNDISIDGKKLTAKMTLNYKDLDKNLIDSNEEKFEIATKGYFQIYIGGNKLKTFSPSVESTFSENQNEITVKSELPVEEIPTEQIELKYICNKLEVIYSATKSTTINGEWGLSYNIDNISDIEQGKTLNIQKKSSLVNDKVNIGIDFDYLVFKDGNIDLVYRYENKIKDQLNNKYNLEFKIYDEFGSEVSSLTSIVNSEDEDKVKRTSTFNLNTISKKITIKPRITKKTILSDSQVVVDGTPIEINLSDGPKE